jgi:hypothetical protein
MMNIALVFSKHKNIICLLEEIAYLGELNFKNGVGMMLDAKGLLSIPFESSPQL